MKKGFVLFLLMQLMLIMSIMALEVVEKELLLKHLVRNYNNHIAMRATMK